MIEQVPSAIEMKELINSESSLPDGDGWMDTNDSFISPMTVGDNLSDSESEEGDHVILSMQGKAEY